MADDLFERTWRCLITTDIADKLVCVQQLVASWHMGKLQLGHASPCRELEQAGLPAALQLVHPTKVPRRRLGSREGRIALLHAVAHIEFSAINLALDAVYRFRNMPAQYYADWLRVAAEECYHFALVRQQLLRLDSDYGHLPAHSGLWEVARYSAEDVLIRMALVPRVLEARGLDVTPDMIRRVTEVGDSAFADILRIIFRDEIRHVRTGSLWFNYICTGRKLAPESTFENILQQYKSDLNAHINGPFEIEARLQAGFTPVELDRLRYEMQ